MLIWPVAWQSRQQDENAVARYINGFHIPVRRHSLLGVQSPIAFQRKAKKRAKRSPKKPDKSGNPRGQRGPLQFDVAIAPEVRLLASAVSAASDISAGCGGSLPLVNAKATVSSLQSKAARSPHGALMDR